MKTVHIIGAGVSGLSSATFAARSDVNVKVYEATDCAGGRARSFFDTSLNSLIDNGNHLLLGTNTSTLKYLKWIGASEKITEIAPAIFPFIRNKTGQRWDIRPSNMLLPFWVFSQNRRIPETKFKDYIYQFIQLSRATDKDTVADLLNTNKIIFENLWDPICRAVLNTRPEEASAVLLWHFFKRTFMRGEKACRPWFFKYGLSAALVDPALQFLTINNANIQFKNRLRRIEFSDNAVKFLHFTNGSVAINERDSVIVALPPDSCNDLLPNLYPPLKTNAIINAHFRLSAPTILPGKMPFLGIIGANTQWLFVRENIVSLTISAAEKLVDEPNWNLAKLLWNEVQPIMKKPTERLPAWRIIKERRATFSQTPAQIKMRPGTKTLFKNLFLAGDATDTGLPATIEGSIVSGFKAADLAIREH